MKTIFLSFSYEWYQPLKDGLKIFEHRSRFCDEEIRAYIYIGIPYQQLVAIITLGKRILLSDWLVKYKDDKEACMRIKNFMERNTYAMPVLIFQEIEPISIKKMKQEFPNFVIPRSYFYLDKEEEIFNYIQKHTRFIGSERKNNFNKLDSNNICTY